MTGDPGKPTARQRSGGARSAARLAAVQAIYQIEMIDARPQTVIAEFLQYRLAEKAAEGEELVSLDADLFTELVAGAYGELVNLDQSIGKFLTADWPLERLETVLRAVLRLGAFELAHRIDVPARVVITEYLEISHAFFSGKEPGMVNGVLDRLAHHYRPAEMSRER
jgi:N utilization substance protein B